MKFSRNERISVLTKILLDNPDKIINLNYFTEKFNAAKSTISEDLVILKEAFSKFDMGKVETIAGAAGGVKYTCGINKTGAKDFIKNLCGMINNKERIIPGEFLYITDLMYNPLVIKEAGLILASVFADKGIDYVVTVETKGIPLAYEVSRMLGVELVIVRRENIFSEGSTVSINYVSGSTKILQTMTLSKRAIKENSKCIFIDDFMKAGGTAVGIINLLKEFKSELSGIGILIDNVQIKGKLIKDYVSLVDYNGFSEEGDISAAPSDFIQNL